MSDIESVKGQDFQTLSAAVPAATGMKSIQNVNGTFVAVAPDGSTSSFGASGVQDVNAGTGITVTGPATHPVVNNNGIVSVAAGSGIGVAVVAGLATITNTSPGTGGAGWTVGVATRRFFAIDTVGGNDGNAGFSDVSATAAFAVAKKTWVGLAGILPKFGNGRTFEIVVGAGTYADGPGDVFNGCVGYTASSIVRGTSTNATAASVAAAGNVAEVEYAGFVTATGAFANGYTVNAGTGTTLTLTKVGGGAAALPIQPNLPQGCRLRFDANTTTVALRNKKFFVYRVPTSGTVAISDNSANNITTVNTDVCYLEMPGVNVPAFTLLMPMTIIGLRTTGGNTRFKGYGETFTISGCASDATMFPTECSFSADTQLQFPTLGLISIGMAWRSEVAIQPQEADYHGFKCATLQGLTVENILNFEDAGSTYGGPVFYRGGSEKSTLSHPHAVIGNGGANLGAGPTTRLFGVRVGDNFGMELNGCPSTIDGLSVEDNVAGGIQLTGIGRLGIGFFGIKGTAITAGGLSTSGGSGWRVSIDDATAMTLTGTKGDMELCATPGSAKFAYAPWTTLRQNVFGVIKDTAGNVLVGGANSSAPNNSEGELLGPVTAFANTAGGAVSIAQWALITETTANQAFLPKADSVGNAAGNLFVALNPCSVGDCVLVVKVGLRLPLIFDVAPSGADLGALAYMSTANAGHAQKAIPALAGTNQKLRLGVICAAGPVFGVAFLPENFPVTADGLK